MDERDDEVAAAPVWAIFSDMMAALVGLLVLILVWVIGNQLALSQELQQEKVQRLAEQQRRLVLEQALADPLAAGRITFRDGRIGINGSVLFALNSDELRPRGKALLSSLVPPLKAYLGKHNEILMVSGYTDDLAIQKDNQHYQDNWDLSAQRALTVTRALIADGMPADQIIAAAFGDHHPVVANKDAASRAQNRRVEISTVPGPGSDDSTVRGESGHD